MNPARSAAIAAAILTALPAHAAPEQDAVRPLADYSPLWTNPVFQPEAENKESSSDEPPEAVGRRVPVPPNVPASFAELEERVQALEAEVKRLKDALRDAANPDEEDEETPAAPSNLPRLSSEEALLRLETLTADEAKKSELKVKRRKILPNIEDKNTHRARIEIEAQGSEERIYQWLHRVHSRIESRALTSLALMPSRSHDGSVTARAVFEQWHLPVDLDEAAGHAKADLRPLTDATHYPLELLLQVVQASPEGLRLDYAEFTNQFDDDLELSRLVRLQGHADELAQVISFKEALKKSPGLKDYRWAWPPPVEDSNQGTWQFLYDATFDPE